MLFSWIAPSYDKYATVKGLCIPVQWLLCAVDTLLCLTFREVSHFSAKEICLFNMNQTGKLDTQLGLPNERLSEDLLGSNPGYQGEDDFAQSEEISCHIEYRLRFCTSPSFSKMVCYPSLCLVEDMYVYAYTPSRPRWFYTGEVIHHFEISVNFSFKFW